MATIKPWWHGDALPRFITDLLADELARLRPGGMPAPPPPWSPDLDIGERGLGADSLERLTLAAALNEALHLHASGIEDSLLIRHRLADWIEIGRLGLARAATDLTFRTSGSTGIPRLCPHRLDELWQEVDALAALFAGAGRVVSAVAAHHIYGFLFTILLPQRLRAGGVEVIDARQTSPGRLAALLRPGDLVVAYPAWWQAIARASPPLPASLTGVTSTAPCPPGLGRALRGIGLARLVELYGASETAGIGWRDDPDNPFVLLPHWTRDGDDLRRDTPGGTPRGVCAPDRLLWQGAKDFRPAGRHDGAVQVGGINVFPAHVRAVLLAHPLVEDAAVRLMRPEEGTRLKAFIVPAPGVDGAHLERALLAWTQDRLRTPERPKAFAFGRTLPRGAMAKAADWPAAVHRPVSRRESRRVTV